MSHPHRVTPSHAPLFLALLAVLVLSMTGVRVPYSALSADASGGDTTGAIVGLQGTVMNATRLMNRQLDEATTAGSHSFSDIQEVYEKVLALHAQQGANLRTAFALSYTGGYNASAPVAGLSSSDVSALAPPAMYYQAADTHLKLNQRMEALLTDWSSGLPASDDERYREVLQKARAVVGGPRRAQSEETKE